MSASDKKPESVKNGEPEQAPVLFSFFRRRFFQKPVTAPPSTGRITPVMKEAAGLLR